ncbi:MAG: hypothetical protein ACTS6A_01015 [Candidatus Hodgkinia cicadicola]
MTRSEVRGLRNKNERLRTTNRNMAAEMNWFGNCLSFRRKLMC